MEYIYLRKVGKDGLREIRRQVVRLKKLGKTGKEIEELTGVRQNRASEIWTAYQREGKSSLKRKKYGRKPGSHMLGTLRLPVRPDETSSNTNFQLKPDFVGRDDSARRCTRLVQAAGRGRPALQNDCPFLMEN